jgi:hypothetical protein
MRVAPQTTQAAVVEWADKLAPQTPNPFKLQRLLRDKHVDVYDVLNEVLGTLGLRLPWYALDPGDNSTSSEVDG